MIKEFTYRLEFNEQQQAWHMDRGKAEPYTHGWITIMDNCNTAEAVFIECYCEARKGKKRLTEEMVKKFCEECSVMMKCLIEEGFVINRGKEQVESINTYV
jgi:hypothetical protein